MVEKTAKVFTHGRSQAVRLPKEFRFEGAEVRISRVGDKVILEPLEASPINVAAWRERLRALGARDFLPVAPDDSDLMAPREVQFDAPE